MTRLTPIQLDDDTTIYIEGTSDIDLPSIHNQVSTPENGDEEEEELTNKGIKSEELRKNMIEQAQTIENTIRAYTIISLNAFKKHTIPDVSKVTLEFGIELGGEAGVPYITKGTVKSNLKITVECSLSPEIENTKILLLQKPSASKDGVADTNNSK